MKRRSGVKGSSSRSSRPPLPPHSRRRPRNRTNGPIEDHSQSEPDRRKTAKRIALATYRWQFSPRFTFEQATAAAEYLRDLGISDCYASPLFQAAPQSTHGYDVCSYEQLNPELGGAGGFERLSARLRELGLGLVLDIVPNHMAADPGNAWWLDVLETGPASAYATWFDIEWGEAGRSVPSGVRTPAHRRGNEAPHPKILLPILEDDYASVLEAGKLRLILEQGRFWIAYHEKRLPVSAGSATKLLGGAESAQRHREVLDSFNGQPGAPHSFDKLHALLQQQHYRLAHWRLASEQINYRRFFDVSSLVSLRTELPEVFEATHGLVLRLVEEGLVTGLRIDHPDGLWDPRQYLERLQAAGARMLATKTGEKAWASPNSTGRAQNGESLAARESRAPLFIVVEKILSADERLAPDWPVSGTTGYDFLNRVNGLFVDSANQSAFEQLYGAFTSAKLDFQRLVFECKKKVLLTSFASELDQLTRGVKRLVGRSRYGQDLTLQQIQRALTDMICAFPVYRTYITEATRQVSACDQEHIFTAVKFVRSLSKNRLGFRQDELARNFIRDWLLLKPPGDLDKAGRIQARRLVMKFQQLTAPVMAKGVEDTAFYNFNRLVSLNEVGGNPGSFGVSLERFHAENLFQSEHWPHSLLATATHDTKHGEDVRARLNVLSEIPNEWREAITRWSCLNAGKKLLVNGQPVPDANDEYLLYQTLIGVWKPQAENPAGLADLRGRVSAYMLKAIREAKNHTSWLHPNPSYENATTRFVESLLADHAPNHFLDDFRSFQRRVAFFGHFNSLSQILLKLTTPGVPDIYQGTELWDFSLVDPDNRRPVDYELRRRFLGELKAEFAPARENILPLLATLLDDSPSGRIKLYLIWRTLQFRGSHRELFENGRYLPLLAGGPKHRHVCAFARLWNDDCAIVVVPRLVATLTQGKEVPPIKRALWADTALPLPDQTPRRYRNVLTREIVAVGAKETKLHVANVLSHFPVALLERVE